MAPCCGAPSGCVWDDVVGWHLAASDKRASELVLFLLRFFWIFFFFLGGVWRSVQGDHWPGFFFHNVWRTVPRIYYTTEVEHPSLTEKHEMIMTLYIPWLSHVMWNYMLSHRKQQAFTHNFNCQCNMVSSSPAFRNCELQTQPATLI